MTIRKELPEFINGFKIIEDLGMVSAGKSLKKIRKCIAECPKCKNHFKTQPNRLRSQSKCACIKNDLKFKPFLKLKKAYHSMLSRCNPANEKKYYADKGIVVCDEWKDNILDFCEWSIENGYKEIKGITLDRIDSDKDYNPDNCRWTDWDTQNRNKKDLSLCSESVRIIKASHPSLSQKELSEKFNVHQSTISRVIHEKRWRGV